MGLLSRADRQRLKALPAAARSALPVLTLADGALALPRPFGDGPAEAQSLVGDRLRGACGMITHENQRPG
jgi:hypothetical protein